MEYFDPNEDDSWMMDVEIPSGLMDMPTPSATRKRSHDDVEPDEEEEEEEEDEMQGGGLFSFDIRHGEMPQRWRNVVHKTRHSARLQQARDVRDGDQLGYEMSEAVRKALVSVVELHPNLRVSDRIHFTMQANAFSQKTNRCFQSTQFRVSEIGEGEEASSRYATYMKQLARQLNSSQSFSPGDDFALDVTTIRMPEEGGRLKKYDVAKAKVRGIHKKSRIVIKNDDVLCYTRVVVTMKAYCEEKSREFPESSYDSLRRGFPCQKRLALALAERAGISTTEPCGWDELQKIQDALTPLYQIKVLQIGRPHMIVFKGPKAPRQIRLVLEDGHYDGCTSFAGMFNTSYYCDDCDKGYGKNDYGHHPCAGRRCPSCHEFLCADYAIAKETRGGGGFVRPSVPCNLCHRDFFGQLCMTQHLVAPNRGKTVCDKRKKCPHCCKAYDVKYGRNGARKGRPHRCGFAECKYCEKVVELTEHQCFIQKVKRSDDDPKTKWVPLDQVGLRGTIGKPKKGNIQVERDPPLFVYADYEAMTNAEGIQEAVLVGYETGESDECVLIRGSDCTARFIEELEGLAVDQDGDDRNVIVVFHNLKGYDGMFLLQHMYAEKREVTRMVPVGVKVLSFTSDRLCFKDSLCFLPFSLASFSETFGLTELHKGFFPHLFNTQEHQDYRGPIPPRHTYDPEGMSETKRLEFDAWYDARVAENYVFDLVVDMSKYCESDVKLLKASCSKFVEEFRRYATFDPMEKCLTIASACNRYWRKWHLASKTVAVKPFNGWKGVQPLQAVASREWLSYQNHLLRGRNDVEAPDHIRHAFNGGEVRIENMLVDGVDASQITVYEFNACFFHGCLTCFPHQRYKTSRRRGDRTLQECFEATKTKKSRLEAAGWMVRSMWECQWKRDKEMATGSFKAWLERWETVTPLEPRDAFFGGRTNAVRLHHHSEDGETIHYQDVTSLYPWVNKYSCYPIGHPSIITEFDDAQDLRD